ncbi:Cupin domain-containing protein [Desulfopila aestuarii DSM 18488]|uniref:Cupin domain-containing protein n=2 Tax=Desulfopila aestuarii TaxID=231440 RepID=A0A1M7Y813_9BACT|nr:Cupin domain-containing protein [Desulfopila aestuarii DSM 18488]
MDTWTRKSGYDTCLQAASDQLNASGTEVHLIRFRDGKFCHFHKTTTEFFHFTKGIGRVVLNGEEQPLYPGTSLVIKSYDVHTFMNDSDEELLEAVMVKVNTHPQDTFVCDPPNRNLPKDGFFLR